jgi:hypothetical protein
MDSGIWLNGTAKANATTTADVTLATLLRPPAWRLRKVVELACAAGITSDQARRDVTDALGHQFPIRLMPPTGGGVGLQAS